MKPSAITRFSGPLAAAIAALLMTHAASAADGTSISTGAFSWSTTTAWSGDTVADGADSTAYFAADLNGNQTITLDVSRTIGNLTFTDPVTSTTGNWTISGTGTTLTLDRTTGIPTIDVVTSGRSVTIGSNTSMTIAGNDGLRKTGLGTLTISGTTVHGLEGGLTVNGGTLALTFNNMSSGYTNLIKNTNSVTLNGGLMTIQGKNTAGTNASQTFNGLTVSGAGSLLFAPNAGNLNLALGAISTASGSSLVLGRNATTGGTLSVTTTTDKDSTTGIYGGRIVYFSGSAYDWATSTGSGPYTLGAYTGYTTTLPTDGSGSDATNYSITTGVTLAADDTINSLKITGSATALDLGGKTLNLKSGGLLSVGTTAQSITGGTLTTGTGTVGSADLVIHQYNSAANNSLAISSNISDNGSTKVNLVKAGSNNLVLAGNNSYTGDTYVNYGTLFIGHSNNQAVAASLGGGSYAGNIRISSGATLHFNNTGNQTLSGVISGDGNLTKSSADELVLSGNNTYTGTTSITTSRLTSTPTLSVSSFNSVGSGTGYSPQASSSLGAPTTVAAGTINISATNSSNTVTTLKYTGNGEITDRVLNFTIGGGNVVLNSSGSGLLKFVSNVRGSGSGTPSGALILTGTGTGEIAGAIPEFTNYTGTPLIKQGEGTWTLSGISTYTGNTTISGGTLDLSTVANAKIYQSATAGAFSTQVVTVNTGGTLKVAHFGMGNTTQSLGQLTTDAARVVVNGGKIQFGAVSTPSTYINNRAITVGANNATLEVLDGVNYTMSDATNLNSYAANSTLTLAGAGTGKIDKVITGSGVAVTKSDAGTWTLTGANDYTGATTIKAGTLKINTSTTIGGSSQITVGDTGSSGAVLDVTTAGLTVGTTQTLAGIGTVLATGQTVTVNGTLAPGNSPGTLTIDGGTLALADATALNFELNPTDTTVGLGVNDLVSVTGDLTLDGVLNVTPTSGSFTSVAVDTAWRLFNYSGTLTNNTLTLGTMPGLGSGLSWSIDTATANQVNLIVVAVPEPRAALLGGLGLLALLRRRRA